MYLPFIVNSLIIAFVHFYFVFVCVCVCVSFALLVAVRNFSVCCGCESFHQFYVLQFTLTPLSPLCMMSLPKLVIFYFDVVQYIKFSTQALTFGYLV